MIQIPTLDLSPLSSYVTLTSTSYPTSLLFPTLPYSISLLPSIFKVIAFLFFLPVILLAGSDIIGWTVFKLILRPLGYASTIRFKDPEPSILLVPFSSSTSLSTNVNPLNSNSPKKSGRPLSTLINSDPSSTSSTDSPSLSPELINYSSSSTGDKLSNAPEPISPTSSTSAEFDDRDPEDEPLSPTLSSSSSSFSTLPSLTTSSTITSTTNNNNNASGNKKRRKRRNRSTSTSSSSSISSMSRFAGRTASIGMEGPMIMMTGDDSFSSDSRSGSGSEEEEEEEGEGEEEEGEGGLRRRGKGKGGKAGIPRGGVAFGFTKVGK